MKKNFYTGVIAALLLASPIAGAENQYPASDFKPKVVYQDADYKPSQSTGTESSTGGAKADPNYPAANFQPKVLYKDADYKPSKSTGMTKSSSKMQNAVSTGQAGSTQPAESNTPESESDYSLGLVVLVLAGLFFFFNKKGSKSAQQKSAESTRNTSGVTGVARYLQDMDAGSAVSGVARYLEQQELTSATGVAKYMAKQASAAKDSASAQISGVEKYLRDKG